jgi:pimeloyl-ACP methyl ester carboxylesterase
VPTLDRELLAAHATHVSDGVEERMFHTEHEGERLFAMLTSPTAREPSDLGFVVAHSFGLEVLTLRRAERAMSRALGAAGHTVLYVQRRGFGDSTGDIGEATLRRQLDDLRGAASWLLANTAASRVAAIGCRFGGLLAALLGDEGSVERLVLVQPVLVGARWARSFLREMHIVRMADPDGGDRRSLDDLVADMRRAGALDVLGYELPAHLHDDVSAVDLTGAGGFAGDALVVQVAKRSAVAPEIEALAERIVSRGGRCRVERLREPGGSTFGSAAFVATPSDPNVRVDVMEPLHDELARIVAGWAS